MAIKHHQVKALQTPPMWYKINLHWVLCPVNQMVRKRIKHGSYLSGLFPFVLNLVAQVAIADEIVLYPLRVCAVTSGR